MAKTKIKKGDTVQVLAGASKGTTGKVIAVYRDTDRVLVEGVNRVTRHVKAGQTSRGSNTGGLVVQESPIHVSNVAIVDPSDKKPTRIKTRVETVERDGKTRTSRTRVGVRSGKDLS
ncbi:ribosomal protein L24 (BL23) [Nostocoides japonicum T1-X7]|uniref:Large ribosomal subunit protein uL24 n=1 Tax=Nostocoides japonicum T1-X7 TaxID=1194083 RepID=A0A077LSU3_9MICO|nr:50S ribosomal protein L24 [Tetrasphaera japonica]CCH76258.1 ribosomal protein L24 (BL23) [Tetrasphaera japonica T1-X7]